MSLSNDSRGDLQTHFGARFQLLQGIEANIDAAGQLDLSDDEAAVFDVVLAAPHSRLRRNEDQTERMIAAVAHPAVRILAHPRGRITGSRAGVIANQRRELDGSDQVVWDAEQPDHYERWTCEPRLMLDLQGVHSRDEALFAVDRLRRRP